MIIRIIILLAAIFVTACGGGSSDKKASVSSAPAVKINDFGIRFISAALMEDLEYSLLTGKSKIKKDKALQLIGIDRAVTSTQLDKTYKDNEISADNEYKGKQLLVSGRIKSISKDAFGYPYLSLPGTNMFLDVHARFSKDSADELSKFKKGQAVTLVCTGSGMAIGSVGLKDCSSVQSSLDAGRENIKKVATGVIQGNESISPEVDAFLIYAYYASEEIPADGQCRSAMRFDVCMKEFLGATKNLKKEDLQKKMPESSFKKVEAVFGAKK